MLCTTISATELQGIVLVLAARGAVGLYGGEGTPVPIPNTAVKLIYADNTWTAASREDKSRPTQQKSSSCKRKGSFFVFAGEVLSLCLRSFFFLKVKETKRTFKLSMERSMHPPPLNLRRT